MRDIEKKLGALLIVGIMILSTAVFMMSVTATEEDNTIQNVEQPSPDIELGPEEQQSRATWYNGNWNYRRSITLTGDGTNYTNLTLRVDLNATMGFSSAAFAKVNALGTDIRFTNNTHVEVLPHWVEYWNDTWEDATLWVKLDSVSWAGNSIFWMYYGNTAATTSTSNGTGTFLHFDTFSGTDYTNRLETPTTGPVANITIYEKNHIVRFQPDGTTYFYEENTTMEGISMAYYEEPIVRAPVYDHYLAYGSLWNDSANYSICGAYSNNGYSGWSRFTNNPIINISYGSDEPDSLKCTEPDWMHNISASNRKELTYDPTYNFTIYYTSLNTTRFGICAANSTSATNPDCTWIKQGIMLDAVDVTWATEVRKPVVWCQGETDYRMLFAGLYDVNEWRIGYATSAGVMGPWTDTGFPVMNITTGDWGWDSDTIIPTDVWGNGTQTWVSYAGLEGTSWRQGIANCSESDPLITWTRNVGHISFGSDQRSLIDTDDCQYGSWNIIPGAPSDDYLFFFHTMRNATHISMGDAVCRNTSWEHHGTHRSVYNLWDSDGDGEVGLYVDTNETYLHNDFGMYEEGGADYHNLSVTVEFWARQTGNSENISVIGRATDAVFASRSHYASEVNVTSADLNCKLALAGTESNLDNGTIADTFSELNDQVHLNLWMMGDEKASFVENMQDNYTGEANASNAQHTNGALGILAHNCPTEFDWFRINNAGPAGGADWVLGGEGTPEMDTAGGSGDGGDDDDVVDDPTQTPPGGTTCDIMDYIILIVALALIVAARKKLIPGIDKKLLYLLGFALILAWLVWYGYI